MDIDASAQDLSLPFPLSAPGTIRVVSGWRGVGKTTYCQQVVEQFRIAGLKVSGLLSPARFENHQKTGIFAVDLHSRQSQLVASLLPGEIEGTRFGPWTFDPRVFAWGNRALLQAKGADLLVIDELGFLEFDLQTGWNASFEVLQKKDFRLAMVVIRPECIEAFSNKGFTFQTQEILSSQ